MIRILFPRDISVHAESTFKYFLAFSDELQADVSVLKEGSGSGSKPGWEALKSKLSFRQASGALQQAVNATQLYPYDLALAGHTKNLAWWNSRYLYPAAYLGKKAHCPVMLIPEEASFSPVRNVLFVGCQGELKSQPLLRKLSSYWGQDHYRFPSHRRRYGLKSSPFSRFDETGYRLSQGISNPRLKDYIKNMAIDLAVLNAGNIGAGWEALSRLPIPTLIFNTHNLHYRNTANKAGLGSLFGSTAYSKKQF